MLTLLINFIIKFLYVAGFTIGILFFMACSDASNSSNGCIPGATNLCYCSGDAQGVQVCLNDRTYGPCDCGDASVDVIDEDNIESDPIEDVGQEDIQAEDIENETSDETGPTGGTWTDPSSGLTWQNPPAEITMLWHEGMDYCENLNLDGHGDWRLPTIGELRSLIRGCLATQTGGSCGLDDECLSYSCWGYPCKGCSLDGGPDDGCFWPVEVEGPCDWYWSSSPREDDIVWAWHVGFHLGYVRYGGMIDYHFVIRCIR